MNDPFGMDWLRKVWIGALAVILFLLPIVWTLGQLNGGAIMLMSWSASFGFIFGMWVQQWINVGRFGRKDGSRPVEEEPTS